MRLLEISIFSLNNDLVRLTKIMNNLVKDLKTPWERVWFGSRGAEREIEIRFWEYGYVWAGQHWWLEYWGKASSCHCRRRCAIVFQDGGLDWEVPRGCVQAGHHFWVDQKQSRWENGGQLLRLVFVLQRQAHPGAFLSHWYERHFRQRHHCPVSRGRCGWTRCLESSSSRRIGGRSCGLGRYRRRRWRPNWRREKKLRCKEQGRTMRSI